MSAQGTLEVMAAAEAGASVSYGYFYNPAADGKGHLSPCSYLQGKKQSLCSHSIKTEFSYSPSGLLLYEKVRSFGKKPVPDEEAASLINELKGKDSFLSTFLNYHYHHTKNLKFGIASWGDYNSYIFGNITPALAGKFFAYAGPYMNYARNTGAPWLRIGVGIRALYMEGFQFYGDALSIYAHRKELKPKDNMSKAFGLYGDIGALVNYNQEESHRFRTGLYVRNIGFISRVKSNNSPLGYGNFKRPSAEWAMGLGYKYVRGDSDLSRLRIFGTYTRDKDKAEHLDPVRLGVVFELRKNLNLSLGRYHFKPSYGFWFRAEHLRFGYTQYQEVYGTSRFYRRQKIHMLGLELVF